MKVNWSQFVLSNRFGMEHHFAPLLLSFIGDWYVQGVFIPKQAFEIRQASTILVLNTTRRWSFCTMSKLSLSLRHAWSSVKVRMSPNVGVYLSPVLDVCPNTPLNQSRLQGRELWSEVTIDKWPPFIRQWTQGEMKSFWCDRVDDD